MGLLFIQVLILIEAKFFCFLARKKLKNRIKLHNKKLVVFFFPQPRFKNWHKVTICALELSWLITSCLIGWSVIRLALIRKANETFVALCHWYMVCNLFKKIHRCELLLYLVFVELYVLKVQKICQ